MSSIWHRRPDPALIHKMSQKTIDSHLGIEIIDVGDDYIVGTMPVDQRTVQPYGVVHGGANVVLAESLGSIAGGHVIDMTKKLCFGQEVSATHVRPVSSGLVIGTARPIHLGKRSHVWEIRLTNEEGKLSCLAKLTLAIVPRETS
jgi:1,4-dihydroxy-2-naphthoyl-CoA hydrolase